ncbi:response regulator [Winogradskyella eckloniae]|uniref:response regulator n=1 Tax=Winogradskyella eckloniae TaxID=1089306 RepID=UPI001566BDC3|nr:response regulator [Winogradskyella eckloniae]NRD19627.1 response regulator [Winogradskyella eckloniae]
MRYYVLFCLFYIHFASFAQSEHNTKVLSENDSITYLTLKQHYAKHINPNPDSSLIYTARIKAFGIEKKYVIALVEAPYFKAHYFRRIQQLDSAIFYFNLSTQLAKEHKYLRGIALAQNGLCRIHYFLGETENAIDTCNKCLEVAINMDDLPIITDTYTALGNAYRRQNNLNMAISYFLKADSIHSTTPQRPDIIAATYQSLGTIYDDLKDYDTSISYFKKANNEFKRIPADVSFYLKTTDLHLGAAYYRKGELALADSILQETYSYFKSIKEDVSVAQISTYLGLIRIKKGDLDAAEGYLEEGFQMHKDKKYSFESAEAILELGKLYINKKEPKKAIYYLNDLLLNYNDEDNTLMQQKTLKSLSEAYALDRNYTKAYTTLEQTYKLKDSLNNIHNIASIREIDSKYQTEKKEQQITLLKSQNETVEQQKLNQRNLLLGGIGIMSVAGLFFYILYRNRQKTNTKLKDIDALKSNFFTNISHEFRTPLTLISSPIEDTLLDETISHQKRAQFTIAKQNSERLLELVNQLLDLSKIDDGQLKLQIQQGNITQLISALSASFSYYATQKNISYNIDITPTNSIGWFDKDAVEKITINLLSNAFKYTPENGTVTCKAYTNNDTLIFKISNTGKGLTSNDIENIFERFYQTNAQNQGSGIGLALVKELVELHKGSIDVKSEPNKETTFDVRLNLNKTNFGKNALIVNPNNEIKKDVTLHYNANTEDNDKIIDSELPILLIVEDNDDLRHLLKQTFDSNYNVITAANGNLGVELALEHIPDLVISDIMMPEKDGIELTKELKTNELTAHIPIILLTAKATIESQFTGVDVGADDYITKPFDKKLLILKVEKLIASRRQLQLRYSQELVLLPKDIAFTNLDEKFLKKVQVAIDDNLVEPSFNVSEFSEAVGMSRMQLHRKLKALTGLTASEFIRSQRLKLATQLLKNSDINMSQIGYSVGFNDHSYFTKCFKETYNCTPSEYAKRN